MRRIALLPFGGEDDAGPLEAADEDEFAQEPSAEPGDAEPADSAPAAADGAEPAPSEASAPAGESPAESEPAPESGAGSGPEAGAEAGAEPGEEALDDEGSVLLPLDPEDLADVRRWLRLELAAELERSDVLRPLLVELDAEDDAPIGDEPLPDAGALGDIAGAAGLELAAAATLDSGWGAVRVRLVVAAADGVEQIQQQGVAAYEELASLPQELARSVLHSIGEADAAPEPPDEEPVPIDALLFLCRGSRLLEEAQAELARAAEGAAGPDLLVPSPAVEPTPLAGDAAPVPAAAPDAANASAPAPQTAPETATEAASDPAQGAATGALADSADADAAPDSPVEPLLPRPLAPGDPTAALACLLDALAIAPDFAAPRELILREAEEAAGGPWMPVFFAALDRLVELRATDLEASLALGDYRRLHFDEAGAHDLFVDVRDRAAAAEDGPVQAMAGERLAEMAAAAGRGEEAVAHLRAAVRFADDPGLYLKLGVLLREGDPVESMRALQRGLALDPRAPRLRLELARTLLLVDEGERAVAELSKAAQGAERDAAAASEASDLLRVILLSAQEAAE